MNLSLINFHLLHSVMILFIHREDSRHKTAPITDQSLLFVSLL